MDHTNFALVRNGTAETMSTIVRAGLALRVEPSAGTSERYLWRCVVPSVEAKYGNLCLEKHSHTYGLKAMRGPLSRASIPRHTIGT